MKIGEYILHWIPNKASNFNLLIPYKNQISYETGKVITGEERRSRFKKHKDNPGLESYLEKKHFFVDFKELGFITSKHLKPNTGIRYSIVGKYWILLIIKQLN